MVRLAVRYPLRVGRLLWETLRRPLIVNRWRTGEERVQTVLRDLAHQGYHCIEGFWDPVRIQRWQDRLDAYCLRPDLPTKYVIRRTGGTRWLRVEQGLPELAEACLKDSFIWSVAKAYYQQSKVFTSLGYQHSYFDSSLSDVKAKGQRIGEGRESRVIGLGREGFHTDNADYGLKTMLLLTDVPIDNGPLTYCSGTHRLGFNPFTVVKEAKVLKYLFNMNTMSLYFTEDEATRWGLNERAIPLTGAKGTLIFFETRGCHKAAPLLQGERKVLWGSFGLRDKAY